MLERNLIEKKMNERGFTLYSSENNIFLTFVSSHMYDSSYIEKTPKRKQMPIINIIVNLEKDEFKCNYNIDKSINSLNSPWCGSILNDEHFDNIVGIFESQAKWLSMIE